MTSDPERDHPRFEFEPPDLGPYRSGNRGVAHVISLRADQPGPKVVLNAIAHGNEPCGAAALVKLLTSGLRPTRGELTFVFANVAAYRAFDPREPYLARYLEEDFNRLWTEEALASKRHSIELDRARELRPTYLEADVLIDLHSMANDGPPLVLCGATHRGLELALSLDDPSWIIADSGHQSGPRLIDHGPFADPRGGKTAILVECGRHWKAKTVEVALTTCLRALRALDMLEPTWARGLGGLDTAPRRVVEVTQVVTARGNHFEFPREFRSVEIIPAKGTTIGYDGGERIVTPYDSCVLVMPTRHARAGQTVVRLGRVIDP